MSKKSKPSKYELELESAAKRIRELGLDKGDVVHIYTVLNHVSMSGMMRKISAYVMHKGEPHCIAYQVRVSGCGMDMGFHLAYSIYCYLYPYNPAPGQLGQKDRPYQKHLRHSWL